MIRNDNTEPVCGADNNTLLNDAKERRQHRRIDVDNIAVDCDMPSVSRVKVKNISSSGALVMADKLINIGKNYVLKIGYKDKSVLVKATVVWAILVDSLKQDNGDVIPLYIAGMQFVDVMRGEMTEIINLLEAHGRGNMYDAFMGSLQGNTYN